MPEESCTHRTWDAACGIRFQVSTVAPGVWRVLAARDDGAFDPRGAAQALADFDRVDETGIRAPWADAEPRAFADAVGSAGWTADGDTVIKAPDGDALTFVGPHFPNGGVRVGFRRTGRGMAADVALAEGERLYGLGERFDACDQRGRAPMMWSEDRWCQTEGNTYNPVPFVLSTRRYGVLLNRFEKRWIDPGKTRADVLSCEQGDAPLDLYVFGSPDPKTTLGDLARLTGFAPSVPDWALGIYVCRHARLKEFGSPEGVDAMMAAMDGHALPYTAVILEGWDAYDAASYAAMAPAIQRLRDAGKQPLVYEMMARLDCRNLGLENADPVPTQADLDAIGAHNPALADGVRRGYIVRDGHGGDYLPDMNTFNPADAPMNRASLWLDVTNPDAVKWWREEVWGPLVRDMGVAGAKIDFCEEFPELPNMRFASGAADVGEHDRYPVRYNLQMHRFFARAHPTGGVCFSRGGGVGAQRYPLMWAGDQLRAWRFLRPQLTACLSAGLSGIPFMVFDLAGYLPSDAPEDADERAIFVRGAEMACFSPAMQTHGTVTRPYDFPADVVAVYRAYSELHLAMTPYLAEQARAATQTGLPMMRHLFIDFPGDAVAAGIEDQYMFGPSVLAAPVLTPVAARDVYLPEGAWLDPWTGTRLSGGQWLRGVAAPLGRTPFYVRIGHESEAWNAVAPKVAALLAAILALA